MIVVLAFFIAGSVWATAHLPTFWQQLPEITGIPNIPGTSLIREFGPAGRAWRAVRALWPDLVGYAQHRIEGTWRAGDAEVRPSP